MSNACNGYRMPTETEWEYTARTGSVEDFWTADGGGSPNSVLVSLPTLMPMVVPVRRSIPSHGIVTIDVMQRITTATSQ